MRKWQRGGAAAASTGSVASLMPGRIIKVLAVAGDAVAEGQPLAILEAMKMEHAVRAPCAGTVAELHAYVGAQVDDGFVLAVVAPQEAQAAAA